MCNVCAFYVVQGDVWLKMMGNCVHKQLAFESFGTTSSMTLIYGQGNGAALKLGLTVMSVTWSRVSAKSFIKLAEQC